MVLTHAHPKLASRAASASHLQNSSWGGEAAGEATRSGIMKRLLRVELVTPVCTLPCTLKLCGSVGGRIVDSLCTSYHALWRYKRAVEGGAFYDSYASTLHPENCMEL